MNLDTLHALGFQASNWVHSHIFCSQRLHVHVHMYPVLVLNRLSIRGLGAEVSDHVYTQIYVHVWIAGYSGVHVIAYVLRVVYNCMYSIIIV